jgi:hypothetical protein
MSGRPSSLLSSRGAVPIDMPAVFLNHALHEAGSCPVDRRTACRALLAEYHEAEGHSFAWGHIIESQVLPLRTWRIVPVALWERLSHEHQGPWLDIPQRLISVAPLVRVALVPHLPRGVRLTGLQAEGRRHRYALCTLLLTDPTDRRRVRCWLQRRLVPELLPELLARSEAALRDPRTVDLGRSTARKSSPGTTRRKPSTSRP